MEKITCGLRTFEEEQLKTKQLAQKESKKLEKTEKTEKTEDVLHSGLNQREKSAAEFQVNEVGQHTLTAIQAVHLETVEARGEILQLQTTVLTRKNIGGDPPCAT